MVMLAEKIRLPRGYKELWRESEDKYSYSDLKKAQAPYGRERAYWTFYREYNEAPSDRGRIEILCEESLARELTAEFLLKEFKDTPYTECFNCGIYYDTKKSGFVLIELLTNWSVLNKVIDALDRLRFRAVDVGLDAAADA